MDGEEGVQAVPKVKNDESPMEPARRIENPSGRPACFKSTIQEVLFVLTATMAIGMPSFLAGSVIVTSSFIGRSLRMTTAEVTWLVSSSTLTSGAFLLFFGRVADLFGRKRLFVGSFFLFSIFCLASGFSQTALTIDILNGVLGLISASSVPPAVGMLGSIYEKPSARKNAAFACFSAGNPLGFVMGTILGGLAASLSNWRAAFWLLAAVFFVLTIISIFIVPRDTADKEPLNWQSLKRFDLLGTVLTISGIGMFCAALTLGGTAADGWKTAYVLVLLFLGVALMIAFVFWELWFEWPLIPMDIWKDRNFTLSLGVMMLGFMSFETAVFFMALFFQDVWHMSSLMVAVHLLPMAINGIIVNIVAGLVLHRISNKLLMFIGTIANTVAVLLFALNRESSSYWWFCFVGFTIIVIGADFEFNVANMYVMSSMPVSQQSVAGGIFQTAARLSTSVCFGISTAVFNAVKKDPNMPSYWDPATQPYTATIWVSLAFAILSVCLVPFLTIGTQGGNINEHNDDSPVNEPNEKP